MSTGRRIARSIRLAAEADRGHPLLMTSQDTVCVQQITASQSAAKAPGWYVQRSEPSGTSA